MAYINFLDNYGVVEKKSEVIKEGVNNLKVVTSVILQCK